MPKPIRSSGREVPPKSGPQQTRVSSVPPVIPVTLETIPKRRVFSAADKLRIVKEADTCLTTGERGDLEAMLRREGIYSSLLSSWRLQLGAHGAAGLAAKKPGRKPRLTEAERRNVELTKRNAVLERKLHIANVLIALQKKAHEVLGLALPESDGDI